ncbi:MAG: hypothetical protein Q8O83_00805 [bacterium]|nr:hypothetical protein [bacterium]
MEDITNPKKNVGKFLLIGVLVVMVALGLYWYSTREENNDRVETTEEALEVLSATHDTTIETNPIKKVPELNPVEKTNPFKTPNPFE